MNGVRNSGESELQTLGCRPSGDPAERPGAWLWAEGCSPRPGRGWKAACGSVWGAKRLWWTFHPGMVFISQSRRQSARLLVRRPAGRLSANA